MIVITDSNIIISALIKPNGIIAKVFKSKSQIQFYAPSFLKDEIYEHLIYKNINVYGHIIKNIKNRILKKQIEELYKFLTI